MAKINNMKNTDILKITKDLISIPSYVDGLTDESKIGQYIYDFLRTNSKLKIQKQYCTNNRFNVIATNCKSVDVLVVGHIDTVQPSKSWSTDPLTPNVSKGNLYGLGSSDMKSGVATMLTSAFETRLRPNTMFVFYIDEEYDFLGMKTFVKEYQDKIKPRKIISLDGSNLSISNGCRGLIEIEVTIKGKSAHAARPSKGINAITRSYTIINNLFNWLGNYVSSDLGPTVYNLAYIFGGQYKDKTSDGLILGKQGNIIPDICQFIIDIRPSRNELTASKVEEFIRRESIKQSVEIFDFKIRHSLGSWLTPKDQLNLDIPYNPLDQSGYIDVQMLWQAFDQVPCFTIGAGNDMAHKADEYVEVANIKKLDKLVKALLTN